MNNHYSSGNDLKDRHSIDDILGAITFNVAELSRIDELYDVAKESGLMNISPVQREHISQIYQETIKDISMLSPYMISVWEILDEEEFHRFFVFHHSILLLCAASEEKKKTLFQVISTFRKLCNTHHQKNKIESRFELSQYKKWRDSSPSKPIMTVVRDAWIACSKGGPNELVLSSITIPKDALNHCRLDDTRLSNLVFQCLWSDFCLPGVKYTSDNNETLTLMSLRTL